MLTSPPGFQEFIDDKYKKTTANGEMNEKLDAKSKYHDTHNLKFGKVYKGKNSSQELSDSEDDSFGYDEEVSVGIDLPALYTTSGKKNS